MTPCCSGSTRRWTGGSGGPSRSALLAVLRRRGPSLPVPGVAVLVLQRREAARGRLGRRLGGRGTDRTGLRGPLGAVVAGGGRDGGCRRRGVGPHAGADAGLTEQRRDR